MRPGWEDAVGVHRETGEYGLLLRYLHRAIRLYMPDKEGN